MCKKMKKGEIMMPAIAVHIEEIAIHKLMLEIERQHNIPPCSDLAMYIAMLETRGLVSSSAADQIRSLYQ